MATPPDALTQGGLPDPVVGPSPSRPAGTLGEPRSGRFLVFAVVSSAFLMVSVDQTIVATALPALQSDLGARVNWSTWTITVYALGQLLMMPVAGALGEWRGQKRVFLTAVAVFTLTSLTCGLATDIYWLVALRALQGLAGGCFMPTATGMVSRAFGRDRDRALGLFSSIFALGGVIGPILGGVFVTYWSWRGIFLVNVPLGALLLVAGLVVLPGRGVKGTTGRLDVLGILLLAGTLLPLMIGMSLLGDGRGWPSPLALALLVGGVLACATFVHHASHDPNAFIPIRFLRGRGFSAVNVLNFLFGAVAVGFGALVPLYAENRYGISSLRSGTLLTARAIAMAISGALAVAALRRTGYRWPIALGFALLATGLIVLAVPPADVTAYTWLAFGAGITGVGMGFSIPASNNASFHLAPDWAPTIAGVRGLFRMSGGIAGIAVTSAILAQSHDAGLAQAKLFVGLAVVLLCSIALVRFVPEHRGSW